LLLFPNPQQPCGQAGINKIELGALTIRLLKLLK